MESKDLSLLEEMDDISDPNQTTTPSSSLIHFALPPSHNINESCVQPSSSNKNSKNLELGIKPLQMKTRKNYNLRKSLAWDTAFFTDEGILDPLELTLITGINANSHLRGFPTISEEGNTSFSSHLRCRNESSEKPPLNRDKPSCSVGNHDSLPNHKVTNKLLSINKNTNRSVSKDGVCLKTLSSSSSSSLKRPPNSNTLKTAKKEAKLPKRPISKRQCCFSATTKGSLAPKPTTNIQKNVELKSFVKNVHGSQSKAKTSSGLPAKELAQKTVRSLKNSSKVASSTKLRLVQLDKSGFGSEIVPDRLQFCEFQEEAAPIAAKHLDQKTATNSNKLLTEAAQLSSLGPRHNQRASNELMISDRLYPCESQECPAAPQHNSPINKPARPSGLRMPSPSLRFFDQRTALESGSLLQKTGSNQKIYEVRPPAEPRRKPMKSDDIKEKAPSTLSSPSASTHLSPSHNYMANISDTKDKFVLQYEVNRPQNHIAIPVSTSGQSIQHQEQNFFTVVDDSLESNPESNLNAGRLDADDQVFVESQKDGIVKKEYEVGLGLENYSNFIQLENLGKTNNAAVVDHRSLCLVDEATCNTDGTCRGNGNAIELKGVVTMMNTSYIPFQYRNIEQSNDDDEDSDSIDVFPTRSPLRDAVTVVQNDDPSAVKWFETCVSALENIQFCYKGQSVNCIMPAESSNLEKGPCASAMEIEDDIFQEKSDLKYTSAILVDVSEKKQDKVDVALIPGEPLQEVQLEFREASPLTDDHNQSSLSHLRPVVELLCVTSSVEDDALLKTESLLQVAQCASTYPQSLEKERSDLVAETIESEVEIHEDIQKSREMGINILNFLVKSVLDEKSQNSCGNILEANPNVEGCTRESISYSPFQSENQTLEGFGTISTLSKIHVEDAQLQLLENNILDHSCSRLTSELHNHSTQDVDHDYIYGNQPEVSNTTIKLDVVSESNHQLLANRDIQQLFVGRSDIYVCDPKPSNAPRGGKEICFYRNNNGKLCGKFGTSGSRVIDSTGDHNEKHVDTYKTEFTDVAVPSKLESSGIDEMVDVKTTCTEYYSALFQREVADSMLEEKRSMFGALSDNGQISVDNDQMVMKCNLSPEKIANLDLADDALYSVTVVPEQSSSHASDLQNSNADAQSFQGNVSDLGGDDQTDERQDCFGILPSMESYNYFTNGMESCGQHPPECNSSVPVSHQRTVGVETTSTAVCSVTAELCQAGGKEESLLTSTYGIGADGSNIRFGQQVEAEVVEEGKSLMVDELHHESDNGRNLKENLNISYNIIRQDNSLVIHPPNAVPFSDEWLAAIEAAGEEILTMKCGAVQHSPPDKSLPEPSPWSPVKKKTNQIGPYDCTKYTNALPSNPNSSD